MEYAYKTVDITPNKPYIIAGFIIQVEPVSKVKDKLNARIMAFKDKSTIISISVDNLGIDLDFQNKLENKLQQTLGKDLNLVISSTHTHFAPDIKIKEYRDFLFNTLYESVINLKWNKTSNLKYSFKKEYFDKVGKSRISNYISKKIYLYLIKIFDNDINVMNIIIYNCHPTVHLGSTDYVTSEYPGYLLKLLNEKYKDVFFTFYQSASGDISTRFTRKSQDYDGMIDLSNKLYKKIVELYESNQDFNDINIIEYKSKVINAKHDFNEIDLSNIPNDISQRELDTINEGVRVRNNILENPDLLTKQIKISSILLDDLKIVFNPNELFSEYIESLNSKKSALVCYSNGYEPYVTPIDFKILTYETFTDTLTIETKKEIINTIKELSS